MSENFLEEHGSSPVVTNCLDFVLIFRPTIQLVEGGRPHLYPVQAEGRYCNEIFFIFSIMHHMSFSTTRF